MADHDKNYDDTLIFIKDIETDSDSWTYLRIDAGTPPTTETIASLGHEPNGYFWDGVVRRLVELNRTPQVEEMDPEGGVFFARGSREELEVLAVALMPYLTDDDAITSLVREADAAGFDFDD